MRVDLAISPQKKKGGAGYITHAQFHIKMAEALLATRSLSALRKLGNQLTCPVCLDDYTNPKLLHCMHAFCSKCLEGIFKKDTTGNHTVTCPVCRKETRVEGIAVLQSAFYIESLFEIKRDLEASHERRHCIQKSVVCNTHVTEAEFYCNTCNEFLCTVCTRGVHKLHSFDSIPTAAQKEVSEMATRLEALELKVNGIEEALTEVDRNYCKSQDEEREIQKLIRESCRRARCVIDEREKKLVGELHLMTEQKLESLEVQKDRLKLVESQLRSCRDVMRESLQMGSPTETLKMKKRFNRQCYESTTRVTRINDIAFVADKTALNSLSAYGEVYVKVPNACNCLAEGDGLSKAKVGELAVVKLSLYDQHNQECEIDAAVADHMISATFYSAESNPVKCSIEKLGGNQYSVKYVPAMKGKHNLSLEVLGQPISRSPFHVSVKTPLFAIGPEPLNIITGLSQPWGLALDAGRERVCVAVSGNKEVVVLHGHTGEKISTAVRRGLMASALEEPTGIALDKNFNLIIADFRLSAVQRLTLEGQLLQSVGCSGSKPLEFSYPAALAINPTNNKIYVAEWPDNDRVQILNHDLSHYKVFGRPGSKAGQFLCPSGIAFDSNGDVYVADSNNARIQVFSPEGEYLREFGKWGKKEGKLGQPMGLCMDQTSNVLYITDVYNHRVSLFSTGGKFLKSFGSYGTGPGQFNKPQGIVVDEFRFIYISDTFNNRVQVF